LGWALGRDGLAQIWLYTAKSALYEIGSYSAYSVEWILAKIWTNPPLTKFDCIRQSRPRPKFNHIGLSRLRTKFGYIWLSWPQPKFGHIKPSQLWPKFGQI